MIGTGARRCKLSLRSPWVANLAVYQRTPVWLFPPDFAVPKVVRASSGSAPWTYPIRVLTNS